MTSNLKQRLITSSLLLFLVILIFNYNFFMLFVLIVAGTLSLLEFFKIISKILKNQFSKIFIGLIFSLFVFVFCFLFFFFSQFQILKNLLFCLLMACIFSDVGGYITGKTLKGPKLSKISPNKTISGSIGSLVLSSITFSISTFFFTETFSIIILIVGAVTSIACQIGDLFFSYLKRKAKIKDSGNFLPGHGGILDRLDGIFFGIPIGLIAITFLYK